LIDTPILFKILINTLNVPKGSRTYILLCQQVAKSMISGPWTKNFTPN